ncbi:hypothetical protein [Roseimarinus sediminis]|uniref:hypothetical protein n=1 Tax=Roseimarinus sediminis TaxID=1610899 RepID=UPI003D235536
MKEACLVVSDRSVYMVNETIHFRVYNTSRLHVKNTGLSKVVYVELVSPDGQSLSRGKYAFNEQGAAGSIQLPAHLLSGNYYLRAYTRWMRNWSPLPASYRLITVINPFVEEQLGSSGAGSDSARLQSIETKPLLRISTLPATVKTNSSFVFDMENERDEEIDVSVSLVKSGSANGRRMFYPDAMMKPDTLRFIPETRGVSISGKVISKDDAQPLAYSKVWMTMMDGERTSAEVLSREDGAFYIDLGNKSGVADLFLDVSSRDYLQTAGLLIDNDFEHRPLNLPFVPLDLSADTLAWYNDLIMRAQLQSIYYSDTAAVNATEAVQDSSFFYGTPAYVKSFDDFIELPRIIDYIEELLPNVRVRNTSKGPELSVYSNYTEMQSYEALVMIDGVKVSDVGSLLKVNPRKISRVEVLDLPYYRGNMLYGGVVHFISKANDMGEMTFPDESIFLSYQLLGKEEQAPFSSAQQQAPANCLYWNPSLVLEAGKPVTLTLNSGIEPGSYDLKIEGPDQDGSPFVILRTIVVQR